MDWDIFLDIHKDMPRQGSGRNRYTKQAYDLIPPVKNPKILDIGCGPGMQTIHLAKISKGTVIGIDIFEQYLDQLRHLIKEGHLEDRVKAVNQSMTDIQYPEQSFDIIWAEGSIFIMGFEEGLSQWKKYLKPHGYCAIHEMAWIQDNPPQEILDYWQAVYPNICTIDGHIDIIKRCGYDLLGHFPLPEDAWWEFYYDPLKLRLDTLSTKYKDNEQALALIQEGYSEIEMFRKYNAWYGSVFYVMQKH